MCYHNGQKVTGNEFIKLKNLQKELLRYETMLNNPLINGFDYGLSAVLVPVNEDDFDLVQMEWGFIPAYLKNRDAVNKMRFGYKDENGLFKPPLTTLNAKGEELLKPGKIYRDAALHRRCLVLSSGFYEWRHVYPLNKKTGQPLKTANKFPYYIGVKNRPYFFMAGIYQPWTDRETGEHVNTFAIVTTDANKVMQQIHKTKLRMPTILDDNLAFNWIFGNPDENSIQQLATNQITSTDLSAYSIAKNFKESLDPTEPYQYEGLEDLVS